MKFNQAKLRTDLYSGLSETFTKNDGLNATDIGKTYLLPSSFTGSPRHMHQLYQDAMSLIRAHGKPDYFITMTCNPAWPEITNELKPYETANDRPELTARVFNLKLKALISDLLIEHKLGKIIAHVYVIEFQKRGLPHAHILLVLNQTDKISLEEIDSIVSAEIPNKNIHPKAYETITKCMLHGPCGSAFPNSPCMKEGKCSKGYPREFNEITHVAAKYSLN